MSGHRSGPQLSAGAPGLPAEVGRLGGALIGGRRWPNKEVAEQPSPPPQSRENASSCASNMIDTNSTRKKQSLIKQKLEFKCLPNSLGRKWGFVGSLAVLIALMLLKLTFAPQLILALIQVPNRHTVAFIPGDLVIGILVPVHERPSPKQAQTRTCGAVREQYGIQRVEAAFRTIDSINADPTILPNITLGIEIRDSCWHSPIALEQSIEFIRDAMAASEQTQAKPPGLLPASGATLGLGAGSASVLANGGGSGEAKQSAQLALSGSAAVCAPLLARQQQSLQQQQAKKVKNIVGVVGPASSTDTVQVQNLLQLFNMPQVGYSATSRDLSNKNFFKYFLRVVPSDKLQAQVMIDLMLAHNWTYITVAYTEGSYGSSLMNAFRERAQEAGICFATLESMPPNADDAKFDELIEAIQKHPNARVVLCMCEGRTVGKLFSGFKRRNIANEYLVVGSDGWSDRFDVVERQEEFALGGISIRIHSAYVNDFDDYYFNLSPFTNHRNPWFAEFWETRFQCNLEPNLAAANATPNSSTSTNSVNRPSSQQQQRPFVRPPGAKVYNRTCTGRESLRNNHKQDAKMAFVQKSIITMALGLDSMQRAICPPGKTGLCPEMLPVNGSILLQHLMNVSFSFLDEEVWFDEQGDPPGKYEILNFQRRRPPAQVAAGDDTITESLPNQEGQEGGGEEPTSGNGTELQSGGGGGPTMSAVEQSLLEKRRKNPLYDSYSTLRVFRPRENAAGHASASARRARRQPPNRSYQSQQAHPPASGYSSASGYEYVHVGSWKSSDGLSFFDHIRWPATMSDLEESSQVASGDYANHNKAPVPEEQALTPKSVCSLPCAKGHAKKIQSDSVKCCWVCVPCRPNEYLFNEFKCKACEKGWWPNSEQTGCEQIPIQYLDWRSAEALTAISIALVGLLLTAAIAIVFIRHNNTPVVKSTTRELSYMILFAMFLCYANTFLLVAKPRKVTCFATRVLPGFAFAMMYGALVTKTNRIARILAGSKKKILTRRLRFMSATSQVAITWFIISCESLIILFMLIREPADKMLDYPSDDRVVLVCNTTTLGIIAPLGFDFFLIAMCTLYAFKTRNVPENFNEAKFIGFTMYTTLVIWAACVVIYLSSEHKVTTLCLCISFSALIALFLLFFPRCYIIIFKPEKNNRSFFTTTKMVRCHIGYQLGSAGAAAAAAAAAALNQEGAAHYQGLSQQQATSTGTGNSFSSNNDQQLQTDLAGQFGISPASLEAAIQGAGKQPPFRHGADTSNNTLANHHRQLGQKSHQHQQQHQQQQQQQQHENIRAGGFYSSNRPARHSTGAEWLASHQATTLEQTNGALGGGQPRAKSEPIHPSETPRRGGRAMGFFSNLIGFFGIYNLFARRSRRKEFDKASSIQQHLRAIRHAENLDRQTHFRRSQVQRLVQRFDSGSSEHGFRTSPMEPNSANSSRRQRQQISNQLSVARVGLVSTSAGPIGSNCLAGCSPEDRDRFMEALSQMIGAHNVRRLIELLRRYCEQRRSIDSTGGQQQPPAGEAQELVLSAANIAAADGTIRHWPLRLDQPADRKLALTLLAWLAELARQASEELHHWRATVASASARQQLAEDSSLTAPIKSTTCLLQPELISATMRDVNQQNDNGHDALTWAYNSDQSKGDARGAEIRREQLQRASKADRKRHHDLDEPEEPFANSNKVSKAHEARLEGDAMPADKLLSRSGQNHQAAGELQLATQQQGAVQEHRQRQEAGQGSRPSGNGAAPAAAAAANISERISGSLEPKRKLELAEPNEQLQPQRNQEEPDPIRRVLECIMGTRVNKRKVADVPPYHPRPPADRADVWPRREPDGPAWRQPAPAAGGRRAGSSSTCLLNPKTTCAHPTVISGGGGGSTGLQLVCCSSDSCLDGDNGGQIGADSLASPSLSQAAHEGGGDAGRPERRGAAATKRYRSPRAARHGNHRDEPGSNTAQGKPVPAAAAPVSKSAKINTRNACEWQPGSADQARSNQVRPNSELNETSSRQVMSVAEPAEVTQLEDAEAIRQERQQCLVGQSTSSAQLQQSQWRCKERLPPETLHRDRLTCPDAGTLSSRGSRRRRRRSTSANCCFCDLPDCCCRRPCGLCNRHRRRSVSNRQSRGRSRSAATSTNTDRAQPSPSGSRSPRPNSSAANRCSKYHHHRTADDRSESPEEQVEDNKL